MKYRNVRVKKRGGGYRLQRAKVLASGKLKFVKNLKRKVSRSSSNPRRKGKTRRRSNPGRGKRGGGRTTKSLSRSLFKLIRAGALVGPGAARAWDQRGNVGRMLKAGLLGYAGIDMNNNFSGRVLSNCWMPYLVACAITHVIPKINGIIRKL